MAFYICDSCKAVREFTGHFVGVGLPDCVCGASPCNWLPGSFAPGAVQSSREPQRLSLVSLHYELIGGLSASISGNVPYSELLDDLTVIYGKRLKAISLPDGKPVSLP